MSVIGNNLVFNTWFVIPQESKIVYFQCVEILSE